MLTVALLAGVASGALAGYLVPGVRHRLARPAGEPVRSTCPACSARLPAGPAGWVRNRCGACGTRLGPPVRHTLPLGVLVCGGLAVALPTDPGLPALLAVALLGLLLGAVDLACLRLPDPLVAGVGLAGVVGLTAAALLAGTPQRLLPTFGGAALCGLCHLVLALLPGSRLGFGDVKLATVLGLPLGWLGWPVLLLGLVLPHLLHGIVVSALLAARRVRRDTLLPLGPALLAGAWLAALLGTS